MTAVVIVWRQGGPARFRWNSILTPFDEQAHEIAIREKRAEIQAMGYETIVVPWGDHTTVRRFDGTPHPEQHSLTVASGGTWPHDVWQTEEAGEPK